jgi:hypothetical protein
MQFLQELWPQLLLNKCIKKEQNLITVHIVEENLKIVEIYFTFQSLKKYVVD